MERLKRRCLAASFSGHLVLLLALMMTPLLISKKALPVSMPTITYIPATILENIVGTGGNRSSVPGNRESDSAGRVASPPIPRRAESAANPPLAPEKPDKQPSVEPEKVAIEPSKIKKISVPETPPQMKPTAKLVVPEMTPVVRKPAPSKTDKENEPQTTQKPAVSSKPSIEPNLKLTKSRDDKGEERAKARQEQMAEAVRRAGEERTALVDSVASRIGSSLSGGVSVQGLSAIGSGVGGDGYASYGQVLMSVYQKAWMEPSEIEGNQHAVKTEITVGRDGRVISARVVERCRSEAVNKSVQRALDRVRFIAPFPSGMNDLTKTFLLDFDLQSKRNAG